MKIELEIGEKSYRYGDKYGSEIKVWIKITLI